MNILEQIKKGFDSGLIDTVTYLKAIMQYNELLEKARTHKYIRKEPDGHGGWRYIYEDVIGEKIKEEEEPLQGRSKGHTLIRRLEKDLIKRTENKFESCYAVKDGKTIYAKDGEKSSIQLNDLVKMNTEGLIFTHNHPSSRCFSLADLETCIWNKFGEVRAIAPNSALGSVVFVFKNEGIPHNMHQHFQTEWRKVDDEVREDFWNKISKASDADHDRVRDECNQTHHIELMKRLKKRLDENEKINRWVYGQAGLNKWKFYWEKYE